MGILDINKYYYFRLRNGQPYAIKESLLPINTKVMTAFVELTNEQIAFYKDHPNASIYEIVNCKLNNSSNNIELDLQEYIAQKTQELKDVCYKSITIDELQYAMANAVLAGTSIVYAGKKHYSTSEAIAVMKQFMDESDKAVTIYETYKPRIEAASSIEAVDTIYNQAISQL